MFGNGKGYSLSDIAAATNCGNGNGGFFGDGNGWWIILLFLFCVWGNGGGWGGGGGNVGTSREISYGFDMNNLENGIRGLEHGICDGFYEMNNALLTGFGTVEIGRAHV